MSGRRWKEMYENARPNIIRVGEYYYFRVFNAWFRLLKRLQRHHPESFQASVFLFVFFCRRGGRRHCV